MITPRTSHERRHDSRREQLWQTFDREDRSDALADGFATLEMLNEEQLAPRTRVARHPPRDAEIITYVRSGAVTFDDSLGSSGIISAGEFRRTQANSSIGRGPWNASHKEWAQVFHLWFRLGEGKLAGGAEQRRFSAADRRGGLCVVASQDARRGSLQLHQDAALYSALLEPGKHIVHALGPGRRAWLHVVHGKASLGTIAMNTGDGAGVSGERAVSLTAHDHTEILLVDFGMAAD